MTQVVLLLLVIILPGTSSVHNVLNYYIDTALVNSAPKDKMEIFAHEHTCIRICFMIFACCAYT